MSTLDHDENALNPGLWVKVNLLILAAIILIVWALMKVSLEGNFETLHLTWDMAEDGEAFAPGVEVHASGAIYLSQTGPHTIFVEYDRSIEYSQDLIEPFARNDLQLQVIQEASLDTLPLEDPEPREYSVGGNVGIAVAAVRIPARGEYVVNVVAPLQEPASDVTLSFQKNPGARYLRAGITIALIVLGCGGAIWTILQRGHPRPGHLG